MSPRLFLLVAMLPLACTYGQVEWDGDPVVGATVEYENCNGHRWTAQTDGEGWYAFDGYENDDEAIPDGPYLVHTTLPSHGHERLDYVNHAFTPCPDDSGKLCDRQDIDFGWRPLSGWEWSYWLDDLDEHNAVEYHTFHNEICLWSQL